MAGNDPYNDWCLPLFKSRRYSSQHGGEQLVDFTDNKRRTPLHYACHAKNKELVQQLLRAGANPYARYVLHSATILLETLRFNSHVVLPDCGYITCDTHSMRVSEMGTDKIGIDKVGS